MSALTKERMWAIRQEHEAEFGQYCDNEDFEMVAQHIADEAIAADRAARAEPVGEVIETWSCVNGHEQGTERVVEWADESNPPPVGAKVYAAPPAAPVCMTCNGHGLIGGFVSADSGYDSLPCPDCNQPAAPVVPEGMVLVPADVVEFLHGAAPLDGVWFGDRHPTERGAFWWRKRLAAAPAPSPASGDAS